MMQEFADHQGSPATLDPITLEVIRHALVAIANQIDANIKRTAFSPYIYEYNDFAVGLTDADGQLVAQCTGGMPPFVADSVGMAVRDGLAVYGRERLAAGDVVLCNHAAVQGQHLNNTVMYTPIHAGPGRAVLIGFFAINVHWIDIGGSVPRSTDIFMEGLQLRSIKLWSRGEPIEEVYRIIENNTRQPTELMGDIAAQLAGCLLGRDLTAELADKYGVATFERAVALILDQSEAAARAFISAMPDGVYSAESFLDNDRSGNEPLPIRVRVVVRGDEMTVDYSGMAEQVKGPINSGYFGGGQTTARVAFKYLLGASEMANEGTFRPLKLVLPPGKILSASPTAPMGNYSTPFPTVIDTVIKALEQALPQRVPGGHFGTHSGIRFYGKRADGTFFGTHDSGHGGWGAGATHDGGGPFRTMAHGDTRIIPLELQEATLPIRIEEFSLRQDSAGAGTFRGGLGFRKSYRILAPCMVQTNLDRTRFPPWGVQGGRPAAPGRFTLVPHASGAARAIEKEKGLALEPGDLLCVETGGGGGYGPPEQRLLAMIQRDLDAGYVSGAAAERDYGIMIGANGRARKAGELIRMFGSIVMAATVGVLPAGPAGAETVEEFYRGKTITMYVGTGVGAGAVSSYPMALGPVIKKYIPGHPNLVVSYMPGAGGIKAASYIYGIAPQDGTAWGFITRGFLLAPLLKIPQAQFDPTRFNWIGSPTRTVSMGLIWNASTEVRTIQDAMRREVVIGATSIAQDTGIFPRALNRIAGTKFKIVTGYAGLGAVDLAIERGEVQGKVGSTWKSLNSGPSARWVADRLVTVLVQLGVKKAPDIPADVPLGLDLAKTPEDRQVLEVLCAPSATGYPSFMGPGVPRERVDAIRSAYLQSLKDPEFIEAVQRQGLDLDPIGAAELADIVRGIYALPEAAVEGARDLLPAL